MKLFNTLKRFITGSNTNNESSANTTDSNGANQSKQRGDANTDHDTEIGITLNQCQGCGENIFEHEESTEIPPYGYFHDDSGCTPSLEA